MQCKRQKRRMAFSKAQINFSELTQFRFYGDDYTIFSLPNSNNRNGRSNAGILFLNNHLQNAFHFASVIFFLFSSNLLLFATLWVFGCTEKEKANRFVFFCLISFDTMLYFLRSQQHISTSTENVNLWIVIVTDFNKWLTNAKRAVYFKAFVFLLHFLLLSFSSRAKKKLKNNVQRKIRGTIFYAAAQQQQQWQQTAHFIVQMCAGIKTIKAHENCRETVFFWSHLMMTVVEAVLLSGQMNVMQFFFVFFFYSVYFVHCKHLRILSTPATTLIDTNGS